MADRYYKCEMCNIFFPSNKGRKYCTSLCRGRFYYKEKKNKTTGGFFSRIHPTCMQHASEDDVQNFMNRIMVGDCWEWIGSINKAGHGQWHPHASHLMSHAHRASYELFKGDIPEGLVVDHLCRNRACVNPDHLEAVSQAENLRRGRVSRGILGSSES